MMFHPDWSFGSCWLLGEAILLCDISATFPWKSTYLRIFGQFNLALMPAEIGVKGCGGVRGQER